MYESFYGLSGQPFRLNPDHRFFFGSQPHRKAMAYLKYGLGQGEGFIVITGPVGSGKSTLVGQLFADLQQSKILAAQIATTQIEADDAIRMILSAFNVTPPQQDKASLLRALEGFLVQQHRAGRRVLLVVDEAQNLPMRTLEELRMLSNLNAGGQSLLQVFLLGQPQFNAVLADPDLEQLRQRVIASYQLEPIGVEETRSYIEHRMRLVGWNGSRPVIKDEVYPLIHEETGGIPRRINTVFNRLLLFGAIEERTILDGDAAASVIAELRSEVAEAAPLAAAKGAPSPKRDSAQDPALLHRIADLEDRLARQERALRDLVDTALGFLVPDIRLESRRLHAVPHPAAE